MQRSSETPWPGARRPAPLTTTRRHRARPAIAALLAVAGLVAAAPAASAAPTWLQRVGVSEAGTQAQSPGDIAVAPDGTAVAGWVRFVGGIGRAEVAIRPPGSQQFGTPQTLSDTATQASAVRVAIDDAGNAAAVFVEGVTVRASIRPAGGAFGPTTTLAGAAGTPASSPDVAISQGAAIATWVRGPVNSTVAQASFKPANSPIFGVTEEIGGTTGASTPAVVMDAAARSYVTFRQIQTLPTPQHRVRVAIREPNASFVLANDPIVFAPSTPITPGPPACSSTNHVDAPQIAVTPDGRATVAFAFHDCRTGRHVIKASARGTTGTFGALDDVSDPAVDSGSLGFLDVAVDNENNAVIVWLAGLVQAASRPSGGSFGAIQDVSGPGSFVSDPSVRFDPNGTAIAVFFRTTASGQAIQSSSRPRGGAFGAVVDISGANDPGIGSPLGGPTPLAIDNEGNAVALWRRTFDTDPGPAIATSHQIMSASFDAAPPVFTGVSIPPAATVGQPVSFAASALDRLTGAAVAWSFGDGGSAGGAGAQHVFTSPGAFTVTATATDAVGNARTTSSTINVQLPPPIDRDGDGFFADQDCDDGNPNIRPNAREIPGNRTDENCDKRAAPFALPPSLKVPTSWQRFSGFTRLTRLEVTGLRDGAKVTLTCGKRKGKGKGPGCPFAVKTVKVRKGKVSATRLVRGARFRTGALLEVRVTTPGFLGLVRTARFVNAKDPSFTQRCLTPGSRKPRRCG